MNNVLKKVIKKWLLWEHNKDNSISISYHKSFYKALKAKDKDCLEFKITPSFKG